MKKIIIIPLLAILAINNAYGAGLVIEQTETKTTEIINDNGMGRAKEIIKIVQRDLKKFNNNKDKLTYLEKLKTSIESLMKKYDADNKNYKVLKALRELVRYEISLLGNPTVNTKLTGTSYSYPSEVLQLYNTGDLVGVIDFYAKKLKTDQNNLIYLTNIAYCYALLDNMNEANKYLDKILEIDTTNEFAITTKLDLLSKEKDPYGKIEFYKDMEKKFSVLSDDKSKQITMKVYTSIGDIYLSLGDYENAKNYYEKAENNKQFIDKLERAQSQEDKDYDFYNNGNFAPGLMEKQVLSIAKAYANEGKYVSAIRFYDLVLIKNNENIDAYVGKGDVYFTIKDYSQAEKMYDKAVTLGANYDIIIKMAEAVEQNGQYEKAIGLYKKALIKNPMSDEVYRKMGDIMMETENYELAMKYYEESYRLRPSSELYEIMQELQIYLDK